MERRGRGGLFKALSLAALALALALPLFSCSDAKKRIEIFPETPFFEAPDGTAKILAVAKSYETKTSLDLVRDKVLKNSAVKRHHPIVLRTDFHLVELEGGRKAWVSEDLRYDAASGTLLPIASPRDSLMPLLLASAALLAASSFFAVKGLFAGGEPGLAGTLWAALMLLSLRSTLTLTALFLAGGLAIVPIDENYYFQIARDILNLDFNPASKWLYTIGNPLLYAPFIAATGAEGYASIMGPLQLFNGLLLSPLAVPLIYLFVRKLASSHFKALLAAALWAVAPFLIFPAELHQTQYFKCLFGIPEFNAGSYKLFYLFSENGCNGLSDTPAALLFALCVLLPAILRPGVGAWAFAATGALFGALCVLRLNFVLTAPLVALLLWKLLGKNAGNWRRALAMGGASLAAFLAVSTPQLVVNAIQLGSPFQTPYVLHDDGAARGFVPSFVPTGANFLLGCNYIYATLAAASIPFIKEKALRDALALWTLPLTLFFCGYVVVGSCAVRFLLPAYPGMLACFVCASFMEGLDWRKGAAAALCVALSCAISSPCHALTPPLPFNIDQYAWGPGLALALSIAAPALCAATAIWLWRASKRAALFIATFSALYFVGSPLLLFAVMAGLLAWTAAGLAKDFVLEFREAPQAPASGTA